MVTAPLVLLAIPSVVIGYLTIQPMLFGDFFKDGIDALWPLMNASMDDAASVASAGKPA